MERIHAQSASWKSTKIIFHHIWDSGVDRYSFFAVLSQYLSRFLTTFGESAAEDLFFIKCHSTYFPFFSIFFIMIITLKKRFGEKEILTVKKISEKKYNAIVKAKEAVRDFDLNNRDLETVEGAVSLTRRLALSKGKYSALAKTALMAVLVSGTFTDNGFRMPPTAAVVSNFKKVSKDMKRHTLSVFVDDPLDTRADEDGYFTMPLF